MSEATVDPFRVLAELNALGVRFVVVGELAATAPAIPVTTDRVEVGVADDDANVGRLRLFLDAMSAVPAEGPDDDPHRASFDTVAGRVECQELDEERFADLRARSTEVNLGRGVMIRVTPPEEIVVVPRDTRDLIGALRAASHGETASAAAASAEEPRPRPRFRPREVEDEFGPLVEPTPEGERPSAFRRVWKVFEDIDAFMTDLNSRPIRRRRGDD